MKNFIAILSFIFLLGIVLVTCKKKDEEPVATCSDRIKNGDETNVDCGGNCPACQCPAPTNLRLNGAATSTQASATWSAVTDATGYLFKYKAISDTVWQTYSVPVSDTIATMGSLQAQTNYEYVLVVNCSYGNSSSTRATFTTP